jgi:hypothetical protein
MIQGVKTSQLYSRNNTQNILNMKLVISMSARCLFAIGASLRSDNYIILCIYSKTFITMDFLLSEMY